MLNQAKRDYAQGAAASNAATPQSMLSVAVDTAHQHAAESHLLANRLEAIVDRLSGPSPAEVGQNSPPEPGVPPHIRSLERAHTASGAGLQRIRAALDKLENLVG